MDDKPPQRLRFDALGTAAIVVIFVVGVVAVVDLLGDQALDPAVLGLLVATVSPLIPALILRASRNGHDR